MHLPIDIDSIKGFLHPDEGAALYEYARQSAGLGPCLELVLVIAANLRCIWVQQPAMCRGSYLR